MPHTTHGYCNKKFVLNSQVGIAVEMAALNFHQLFLLHLPQTLITRTLPELLHQLPADTLANQRLQVEKLTNQTPRAGGPANQKS